MKLFLTAVAAAALALAPPLGAQCIGPDGFEGPCCTTVAPNWPSFPPITNMPSQGDCWDSCGLSSVECLILDVSPPVATSTCGQFFSQFTASDCGFNPILFGGLDLTYMRTWDEVSGTGDDVQVWRFHAKIDLFEASLAPPLCSVPSCATATSSAFYYGYVDHAFNCTTGGWDSSIVLFHNCDEFIHDPSFSSTPGLFHPGSTFAIVGPDTSTNPFVPATLPVPPAGILFGEATREVSPLPFDCRAEERITQGSWLPFISGCLCPLSLAPPHNTAVHVDGATFCGSSFSTLNFWPNLPWFDFVTTSIGSWSNDSSYPGDETAHVGEGLFFENHGCSATQTVDVMYGSITRGGFDVVTALTDTFVDLASNYSENVPGPYVPPFFGNVIPSRNLIYFNL